MTNPSNRINLDYNLELSKLRRFSEIIDIHSHINGEQAALIFKKIAELSGITKIYSMTQLEDLNPVKSVLGEMIDFIAIPNFYGHDRRYEFGKGYLPRINKFREFGCNIVKFWNAPRIYEASTEPFVSNPFRLDAEERIEIMKVCADLGMTFMVHVADPDTWFATKYRDQNRYGSKLQQYEVLEKILDLFNVKIIAAHMGGYPEDLDFLSRLLDRNLNLFLDVSATKWIVRELSKHPKEALKKFFSQWQGRLLFGSDIVTSNAHLSSDNATENAQKANNEEEAFSLYASRYWALRTLFETNYYGESPISDPDLALVEPIKYSTLDAPNLIGMELSQESLDWLYFKSAKKLLSLP